MVQGSDDDEDWEKICAQEGLELVQESDTESEGGREGWMSDRNNEGTESEMVGEGSESESESVSDSDSEKSKHASTDSDSEHENSEVIPKRVQVGNKITFECRKCHFKCGSSGRVYSHMNKKHNMKKFKCRHCDFSTPNKTSLLNHLHCYCKKNGREKKRN